MDDLELFLCFFAKAEFQKWAFKNLDSRCRGNDEVKSGNDEVRDESHEVRDARVDDRA